MAACDVLIVGGGPAGSTCAWRLRRAGLDVVVWDRRTFPRDKTCAGWITPQVLAALDLDLTAYAAEGRTVQVIRGFRVSRMGDAEACVRYPKPVSFGIRRCEFDDYLLHRSGATLQLGRQVGSLRRVGREWVVNDDVRARVLVGAGGHFCPVAQMLDASRTTSDPIVAAQEAEFRLSPEQQALCRIEPEVPELFFTRDLKGYGWVFRKGAYINVGLGRSGVGRQDARRLSDHVAEFVDFLERRGTMPAGLPAKFRGHAYLLYGEARRPLRADAVLLIGDAAGLAYDRSGEGIRPAIESGLLAAQTILAAAGRYDGDALAAYERQVVARFGARQGGANLWRGIPLSLLGTIAGKLFANAWFARHIVVDRWFLHAHHPPLAAGQ